MRFDIPKLKKMCLVLVWISKKLRHYVLNNNVKATTEVDPLKYLMAQPILHGKISLWTVLLS